MRVMHMNMWMRLIWVSVSKIIKRVFIRLSSHLFIHSFIHSFIRSFIHSLLFSGLLTLYFIFAYFPFGPTETAHVWPAFAMQTLRQIIPRSIHVQTPHEDPRWRKVLQMRPLPLRLSHRKTSQNASPHTYWYVNVVTDRSTLGRMAIKSTHLVLDYWAVRSHRSLIRLPRSHAPLRAHLFARSLTHSEAQG